MSRDSDKKKNNKKHYANGDSVRIVFFPFYGASTIRFPGSRAVKDWSAQGVKNRKLRQMESSDRR